MSSEKVPVQVSAREGYKVKKSRTGKAVMVFGFPMSLGGDGHGAGRVRVPAGLSVAHHARGSHDEVLMVSQVPLFLVVAESLLAFQASSYPELTGPDDAYTEISTGNADDPNSAVSIGLFDDLLSYECAVEDDLADRRQTVGMPFVCREAALITDRKDGLVGIVLGRPVVDGLVAAGAERSLADQVRVFTYLVRISCKLVGSRGGVTGFGGDAICFFRMIVGILRRLVRIVRLEIRDEADDYRNEKRQCRKDVIGVNTGNDLAPVHDSSFLRSFVMWLGSSFSSLRRGKEPLVVNRPMEVW